MATDSPLSERLRGLIERLEKLEGPDREIDADIYALANGGRVYFVDVEDGTMIWEKPVDGFWIRRPLKLSRMPRYTASLDAAVALVERVLPGWKIANIGQDDGKRWHAELRRGYRTSYSTVALAGASLPAIALVIATLRALSQEQGK